MRFVREFRDEYLTMTSDLQLTHFPIYASRLQFIQLKMKEWRPQSFRELAIRPYNEPLTFYAFWFAAFIGIVTILGLGVALVQSYAAMRSMI
jgi:hypothetical protein